MPDRSKFDVIVEFQPGIYNSAEASLGGAMASVTYASSTLVYRIDGDDLVISDGASPDLETVRFKGTGFAVDKNGVPSGMATSIAVQTIEGDPLVDFTCRSPVDVGALFHAIVDNDELYFFNPISAPNFFEAFHGGNDFLSVGTRDSDVMFSGGPGDVLLGRRGTDTFFVVDSARKIDGGKGNKDLVDFYLAESGVKARMDKGWVKIDGEKTKIKNVERVSGTDHDDVLRGGDETREILGWDGNDRIVITDVRSARTLVRGGEGDDDISFGARTPFSGTVFGDSGDDVITIKKAGARLVDGGEGADTIIVTCFDGAPKAIRGGAGEDTFVFELDWGPWVTNVKDYEAGEQIRVKFFDRAYQDGDDVVIRGKDGWSSVRLLNTDRSEVDIYEIPAAAAADLDLFS